MFKSFIQKRLESYAKKYLAKHQPKLILVTGSVGKTSTKLAIATVLSEKFRVRAHEGSFNTELTVPLAILGINLPDNPRSVGGWLRVRQAALERINSKTNDCDVIVQELGADKPGDIAYFGSYLHGDIAVVTAVSAEHMENFKTLDAVAKEELAVSNFSALTLINRDDIDAHFAEDITTPNINTYGLGGVAEYRFEIEDSSLKGTTGSFIMSDHGEIYASLKVASESGVKAAVAAAFVGEKLGLDQNQIATGTAKIVAPPGRMNILRGLKQSTIIDDTYNSSPLAFSAALETLYGQSTSQRIAILGDMNELGEASAGEHEKAGQLCNPALLNWVITVGPEAKKYLAPAAKARGCAVRSFMDPLSAGAFAHSVLETSAVVLAKGSQNNIFVEEALKILLHDSADEAQLVRQTPMWLAKKHEQFAK
jgi:UDP-N-acetylmuramoyl-tripeptide--D-alanyl-D-alanine ligase